MDTGTITLVCAVLGSSALTDAETAAKILLGEAE